MLLDKKVALVTGGAQGIGRAFCESLLENGAKVALSDTKDDVGKTAAAEMKAKYGDRVMFMPCDVTNPKQMEDTFMMTINKFGGLDVVVNNAGVINETDAGWEKMVDINMVAVARGTQLGLKYMGKNAGGRGGTVINIASITSLEPFPSLPVYSATKAAVNQLTRSYGHEVYFKKTGVRVMAINPGITNTPMVNHGLKSISPDPDIQKNFVEHFNTFHHQKPSNMGKGLIEVLQKGENGSLWTVENDEPAKITMLS